MRIVRARQSGGSIEMTIPPFIIKHYHIKKGDYLAIDEEKLARAITPLSPSQRDTTYGGKTYGKCKEL